MAVTTKTFTDLVRGQVAAIQGAAAGLVDFTIGSLTRAFVEAFAQVVLWLQGNILALLAATRAATSSGSDLDSWMADYGLTRLAASFASGAVTFSRFTATAPGFVPVGAQVETVDGSVRFVVSVDEASPAYSATQGGYIIPAGQVALEAPVVAVTAGAASNASPGSVSVIVDAIAGIDTVVNAEAMTGGAEAEGDSALRARFVDYIASLAKATAAAVEYAVGSIQTGVTYALKENETYGGEERLGYFYVVVDDGSGAPSSGFLNAVRDAVDLVRPLASTFGVFGPQLLTANVTMSIVVAAGYGAATVQTQVQAALTNYISSLALGEKLAYTRLSQVAYGASAGVINVTGVLLNGGVADMVATAKQAIRPNTVTVDLA